MLRERNLLALLCAAFLVSCRSRPPSTDIAADRAPAVSAAPSASAPPAASAESSTSPSVAVAPPPLPTPSRSTLAVRTSYVSQSDCAITTSAEVECWSPATPPALVRDLGGVDSLVANDDFTCARTTGGAVRCWGSGPFEPATPVDRPSRIKGLPDDVQAISAGAESFCARRRSDTLRCLTKSFSGWSTKWTTRPGARAIVKGGSLDCWALHDGPVTCKGGERPVVATLPGRYLALAISGWGVHGTAAELLSVVEAGGKLRSYRGGYRAGQSPERVVPLPRPVVQIGAGVHLLCALLDDGSVRCWRGRPNIDFRDALPMPSTPERAVEIAVGDDHACARLESGKVACFGREYTTEGAAAPKVILGG